MKPLTPSSVPLCLFNTPQPRRRFVSQGMCFGSPLAGIFVDPTSPVVWLYGCVDAAICDESMPMMYVLRDDNKKRFHVYLL